MARKKKRESFEDRLTRYRLTNSKGAVIPLHHAFKKIRFSKETRASMLFLPIIFCFLLWAAFPAIVQFWGEVMSFFAPRMVEKAGMATLEMELLWQKLSLPYATFGAALPGSTLVFFNLVACIIPIIITILFPSAMLPFIYTLRACLVIQASASVYFIISPEYFPYEIGMYTTNLLAIGLSLMMCVPIILAFVYYIFDFPIRRKIGLTLMILVYFIIVLPLQALLHAYILHFGTMIFMPLLYFVFGMLINILMFMAFYGLGMSWRDGIDTDHGRFA